MSIYENFISDEEIKSILETQEIKYKLDLNEWYAEGKEEGETNVKIDRRYDIFCQNGYEA